MKVSKLFFLSALFIWSCAQVPKTTDKTLPVYDVMIRNGTVYDGSGSEGFIADVAISGDRIAK